MEISQNPVTDFLEDTTLLPEDSVPGLVRWKLPFTFQPKYHTIMASIHMVFGFAAIITNPLTITAVWKFKNLRKSVSNILIVSLSFSDILFGLSAFGFGVLGLVVHVQGVWSKYFGLLTQVLTCIGTVGNNGSIQCIVWIAVDRVLATADPFKYKTRMTLRVVGCMLAITWLYCVVTYPTLVTIKYLSLTPAQRIQPVRDIHDMYPDGVWRYLRVSTFLLTLGLVIILYAYMCVATIRQSRKVGTLMGDDARTYHQMRSLTKTMLIIIGALLISWIPMAAFSMFPKPSVQVSPGGHAAFRVANDICTLLMYSNSFLNVFVYAWKHKQLRKAYLTLLSCGKASIVPSSFQKNSNTSKTSSIAVP